MEKNLVLRGSTVILYQNVLQIHFLTKVWLVGNMKRRYLYHEVAGNQFCGWVVEGLNPVT